MRLALSRLLAVGHVKRWHMVRVLREQTLGEHLARVQLIAMDVIDEYDPHNDALRLCTMQWALWHDMPEVVTGDVSPPYKSMLREKDHCILRNIDESVDERFKSLSNESGEIAQTIVKFADMAEAVHFLSEDGFGRRTDEIKRNIDYGVKSLLAATRAAMLDKLAMAMNVTYGKLIHENSV